MPRAHYVTYILDNEGRPIPGSTVSVRNPDTTNLISDILYTTDGGSGTKTNPFTSDTDGRIEVFIDAPKIVDFFMTKTGFDSKTIRGVIMQLNASTLVVKDGGTTLAQRSILDFQDGFVGADNAGTVTTEIDLDYATTTELGDVAAAEVTGTATKVPRGDHIHAHGSGYLPDAHHARSHNHSIAGDSTALLPATLTLPGSAAPAQTAEGSVVWDTDDDQLTVGDAVGRKIFIPVLDATSDPLTVAVDGAAADGTEATVARKSHVHTLVTSAATPVDVAATGAAGTSGVAPSRGDHVHKGPTFPLFARKTVDETVFSSTVLQNDNDLFFAVGASETWLFEINAGVSCPAAADFKYDFTLPAGGAARGWSSYEDTLSGLYEPTLVPDFTIATTHLLGSSTDSLFLVKGFYIGGGSGGTVQWRWAQSVSSASSLVVKIGSWIQAQRVA